MKKVAIAMPAPNRAITVAYSAILVLALMLVGRSLALIYDMARPMPYWDAWEFMKALPAITTGRYTLADLVAFHNEHRIVTTRLIMLADLRFFDLSGYLPTAITTILLALIGGLLGFVACGRGWIAAAVAAVAASLLLSVAQSDNYSSGFQVQFPLVDMLAMACLGAVVATDRLSRWAWPLLGAAVLANALAIGTMASGNLAVAPLLLVGLLLRMPLRRMAAVALPALALSAAYAIGYPKPSTPPSHDILAIGQFAVRFLGAALRGYPGASLLLGTVLVCGYGVHLARLADRWRRRQVLDPVLVWLAGIGAFVICGAVVTATGRLSMGMEVAISSRYALQSMLFACCVVIMTWRVAGVRRNPAAPRLGLAAGFLALSAASTLAGRPLDEWRARVADYDTAGQAFTSGVLSDRAIAGVYPFPDLVRPTIRFMAAHGLGPFSSRFAAVYRPPTNPVGTLWTDMPPCAGFADDVKPDGQGWVELTGWAVDPAHPAEDGWILVYDGNRRLMGFGRQSGARPDAAADVHVSPTRLGFQAELNVDGVDAAALGGASFVLVPSGRGESACRVPVSLAAAAEAG